jgi:hypothetical protein
VASVTFALFPLLLTGDFLSFCPLSCFVFGGARSSAFDVLIPRGGRVEMSLGASQWGSVMFGCGLWFRFGYCRNISLPPVIGCRASKGAWHSGPVASTLLLVPLFVRLYVLVVYWRFCMRYLPTPSVSSCPVFYFSFCLLCIAYITFPFFSLYFPLLFYLVPLLLLPCCLCINCVFCVHLLLCPHFYS